jgi:hypothetical protein
MYPVTHISQLLTFTILVQVQVRIPSLPAPDMISLSLNISMYNSKNKIILLYGLSAIIEISQRMQHHCLILSNLESSFKFCQLFCFLYVW